MDDKKYLFSYYYPNYYLDSSHAVIVIIKQHENTLLGAKLQNDWIFHFVSQSAHELYLLPSANSLKMAFFKKNQWHSIGPNSVEYFGHLECNRVKYLYHAIQ